MFLIKLVYINHNRINSEKICVSKDLVNEKTTTESKSGGCGIHHPEMIRKETPLNQLDLGNPYRSIDLLGLEINAGEVLPEPYQLPRLNEECGDQELYRLHTR